jgi:DNA-binding NtrC family response regulator
VNQPTKTVVLVDDDREYADLMIEMLAARLDCPVLAFTRPLEALQALAQIGPSVVVTDYNMPQLDGLEFIRKASSLVPQAVFVLISGHDLSDFKDKMDRLGALKSFLAKPFSSRNLADEIRRVWPGNGITAPGTDAPSV